MELLPKVNLISLFRATVVNILLYKKSNYYAAWPQVANFLCCWMDAQRQCVDINV